MMGFVQQWLVLTVIFWQSSLNTTLLPLWRLGHEGRVGGAIWHEEQILTWSSDFHLWTLGADEPSQTLVVGQPIDGAQWLDDGTLVAWVNSSPVCSACIYQAMLWTDFDNEPYIYPHPTRVTHAVLSPDSLTLLTTAADGKLRLWIGQDMRQIEAHTQAALGASWNSTGTRLLSWSVDGTARVWDAASGDLLLNFQHEGPVLGAAWNSDETQVLTWSKDGTARVWDAASGVQLARLAHEGWVTAAAWDQRGQVVSASTDGRVRLWEGEQIQREWRLGGPVNAVTWNGDGSQMLVHSLAYHSYLTVWDVETGQMLGVLPHLTHVNGVTWVDNRVLTWADDGWARVWVVPNATDCLISTPHDGVNQREVPSVNGAVAGRLTNAEVRLAIGQTVDGENYVWWQLSDGSWVREDVVEARGACEALPMVTP